MSNERAPTSSTHYLIYSLVAAAFFCFAHVHAYSSPLILVALSPLIVFQSRSQSTLLKALVILPALILCGFMGEGIPVLTALAWILFSLGGSLWGKQRSFLAFLFLFLSAEVLPFYLGLDAKFGPRLSANMGQLEFFNPAFEWLGYTGVSLIILIFNYGLAQIILGKQRNESRSKAWIITALTTLFIPIIIGLTADANAGDADLNPEILSKMDSFLARMSFFIAFFLLLFALVRQLLPQKNADDRFT